MLCEGFERGRNTPISNLFYPLAPLFAVQHPNTTEASPMQELTGPIFHVSALIHTNPKAPVLSHRLCHCGAHTLFSPDTHQEELWALWGLQEFTAPSLWPAANSILRNSTWALAQRVSGLSTCKQSSSNNSLAQDWAPQICLQNLVFDMFCLLSYSRDGSFTINHLFACTFPS